MRDRGLRHWVPTYLSEASLRRRGRAFRKRNLTHLIFLVCDHFEPRHGIQEAGQPAARMRAWRAGFHELQADCLRLYGLRPLHTWFYPPHHGEEHLAALARMAFEGLGEVELHYHHEGDTAATLRSSLREVLARYHRAGLLLQTGSPPGRRFGFIHGDWALDNSAHGRFCGVNDELSLLQELGCWADLTMPSANECQTRKINSIYYAAGRADRAKSHDWGDDARVGRAGTPGLMLIQGPLGISLRGGLRPRVENASLTSANWGDPDRIRSWIDCNVHVRGRPEWLFIKLHTHGAVERDFDALFGERARRMHAALAEQYNDGRRFRLHYVTARQAFNLVRAAEQGASGDPAQFLDWDVAPPVTSLYWANRPHETRVCTPENLLLAIPEPSEATQVGLRYAGLQKVTGPFCALEVSAHRAILRMPPAGGITRVGLHLSPGASLASVTGATVLGERDRGEWLLEGAGEVRLSLAGLARAATASGEVS
ncbi:MAG TPA: hypothetical protein VFX20_15125 [Steroidobacteraceae bacterium]|nr:hypothetical protein [Steroidobacteraceae bacterium]